MLIFIILETLWISTCTGDIVPSEDFTHSFPLAGDDIYHLFWKYDKDYITFEVHVKTKGYVGFGISASGGMKDSDVIIGWISDGKTYFDVSISKHCHTFCVVTLMSGILSSH